MRMYSKGTKTAEVGGGVHLDHTHMHLDTPTHAGMTSTTHNHVTQTCIDSGFIRKFVNVIKYKLLNTVG